MSVKLTDVVKIFTGDGKTDVVEWLKKAELVAKLQKVEELAAFVPLFLEGDAFAIYDQLSAEDQADYGKVKSALLTAFSMTPFQAYETFKARQLKPEEAVDAYLADLKRLQSMFVDGENEQILAVQFVSGLPLDVGNQLKALREGSTDIRKLRECSKQLLQNRSEAEPFGAIGASGRSVRMPDTKNRQGKNKRCTGCFRFGHAQDECQVKCHECGKPGHLKRNCPDKKAAGNFGQLDQGNEPGEASGDTVELGASPYPMGYQQ